MSILSFRALLLLVVVALILCSSVSNAVPMKEQEKRVMPGGYHKIPDLRDVRVRQAATFAMEQKMVGQETTALADARPVVVRGYQQVVAGMNYNLEIVMVRGDDNEVLGGFSVTVYDQFGQLSITKWGNDLSQEQAEAVFNGGQGLQ